MTKDFLVKIFKTVQDIGEINHKLIEYIEELFPNKSKKVLDVLNKGIWKYIYKPSNRIIWITLGEKSVHLIYPRLFCSCQDFYKNVVIKGRRSFCKHILAQIVSEALEFYEEYEWEDKDFKKLIKDLDLKFK